MRDLLAARQDAAAAVARDAASRAAAGRLLPAESGEARIRLFAELARIDLPPETSGFVVRDAAGRPAAFLGRTFELEERPPARAPTSAVVSGAVYRVLEVEIPIVVDGVPAGSVAAFSPFDLLHPIDERWRRRGDFETDAAERTGAAAVFAGDPAGEAGAAPPSGELAAAGPFLGLSGEPILFLGVAIHPPEVLANRILARGASVQAALAAAIALLMLAAAAGAALHASGRRRAAWLALFPPLVLGVRVLLFHAGFPALVIDGPTVDPASFSHPVDWFGLELGLLHSPADAALSGLFLLAAAAVPVAALARFARPRLAALDRPALAAVPALGAAVAVLILVPAWLSFVHVLPFYSTVEFFSEQTVLPDPPAGLLLLSLFLATGVLFLLTTPLTAAAAALFGGARAGRRALAAAATALVLFPAILIASDLSPALAGIGAVALAGAGTVAVAWPAIPRGARFAVLAALTAVFSYGPFQREAWRESRADVEESVEAALREVGAGHLKDRLASDLAAIARRPELAALLAAPGAPDGRAAFAAWIEGPLSRRPTGVEIRIADAAGRERSRFSIEMPPRAWLPAPPPLSAGEDVVVRDEPGVGSGEPMRFLTGSAAIRDAAGNTVGSVAAWAPHQMDPDAGTGRELYVSEYEGEVLVSTTHPDYPKVRRAPPEVARAILVEGAEQRWMREEEGGRHWINLYRPRIVDDEVVGLTSVGFASSERRDLFLSLLKLVLVDGLAALAAVALFSLPRMRRFRPRFQHKLLVSYLLVSAAPLILLAELNRRFARESVEEAMQEELASALRLVEGDLKGEAADPTDDRLKEIGWRLGLELNLYRADGFAAPLAATSEPGAFAAELFPDHLPGEAYLETILRGRRRYTARENAGGASFLVGFAPIVAADGRRTGAISVPTRYGQDRLDRELARRNALLVAVYLLLLFTVFVIGVVLARRIAAPIESLTRATRRLSAGDLAHRIPDRPRDEFGELVESFNRMTADLAESRERLVSAEKDAAWREMAKQVAHEIKNPLTPMKLSAQHVRKAWEDGHPEFGAILERGVDTIIRQIDALRRIAGEFSALARLRSRPPEPMDVAEIAREVAGLFSGAEGVVVREELRPVPPVLGDRDDFRRALVNLATNAVQAMDGRAGTLTLRTGVASARYSGEEREVVEIAVVDDGPGIRPEDMARLFQPSFSTKTGGAGLGLAITKAIVESAGGEIHLDSTPGRGTTATIRLPPAPPPGSPP